MPIATNTTPDSPVTEASQRTAKLGAALIGTLALLSAIAPLATDLYLSAFPAMTLELATTATGVQLSLTTFLVGAGLGQVIFGPLSDRIGRRGPLLTGLVIYLLSSVAAAAAPTVEVLVVARLVQGLSGAAGMVLSRAIIADLARGAAAARALSAMMLVSAIAPISAPFLGSVLVGVIGWRGLLGIVAALGAVSIVFVLAFVKESRTPHARRDAQVGEGRLLSRRYLGYTLTYGFAFATMMAYISASPFVYQNMIGMSEI
ncbi:MFS transporter [Brevibacterium salitolerans]|uniref:Major facilitator superfamily (MFS) profile domain-containing protein n=1 Tax=Brevibacterium salitolerans TaxID=1403566 RepID=A0ABP5HXX4_9MICO